MMSRYTIALLLLISSLGMSALATPVATTHAAGCVWGTLEVPLVGAGGCIDNLIGKNNALVSYIGVFLNFFLVAIVAIALISIVIAGYVYMTAGGSAKRVDMAKDLISGALIGLTVALLSYALLNLVGGASLTPNTDPHLF